VVVYSCWGIAPPVTAADNLEKLFCENRIDASALYAFAAGCFLRGVMFRKLPSRAFDAR